MEKTSNILEKSIILTIPGFECLNQSQSGIYIGTGLGSPAIHTVFPAFAGIQETVHRSWARCGAGAGAGQCWKLPTPGADLAWAWSSSRAGFQDTINAGGSDVDRGAVSRFKAPRPARCCVDHLDPRRRRHCLPSVDAGQSPKPVHRCKVDLEFIRPLSKSPCPQPSNGIFPETGSANSSAAVFDLYRHTFWCSRDHPAPDRPGYQSTKGRSPGPRPSGPSCCGRPRIP